MKKISPFYDHEEFEVIGKRPRFTERGNRRDLEDWQERRERERQRKRKLKELSRGE